jgi:hypothetical protein
MNVTLKDWVNNKIEEGDWTASEDHAAWLC